MTDDRREQILGRLSRAFAILAAVLLVVLLGFTIRGVPDRYKPWAELSLDAPIGPLTQFKLARLRSDTASCLAALESGAVAYSIVPPREGEGSCGWQTAVALEQGVAPYSAPQPVVTQCALAASLHLWETQVLAPAVERHFGQGAAEILHYGTYSCRPVNNQAGARLSEHARANAIDIAGIRLADGRVIRVSSGWTGPPGEQAFLRELHAGGCGVFRGVIGPDGDAAHRDHFHFDMGRWDFCR